MWNPLYYASALKSEGEEMKSGADNVKEQRRTRGRDNRKMKRRREGRQTWEAVGERGRNPQTFQASEG